jgi:hypothetical protein
MPSAAGWPTWRRGLLPGACSARRPQRLEAERAAQIGQAAARVVGQAAAALRAEHGTLLSSREPTEAPLLIDTLVSLGRGDEAKDTAKAALRQYRDGLETDPWRAASKNHQRVLDAAERAGLTPGVDLGPAR